jgi:hypothetical protein
MPINADSRAIDWSHTDRPLRAVRIAVFRGIVPMCPMDTTDRPLRAVPIVVMTPVRPANDRSVHVHRGERQSAERERKRDQIFRKIFHRLLLHLRQKTILTSEG